MGIESTIAHPYPRLIETHSDHPTNGHTYAINLKDSPHAPFTSWRRARFTYEWSNLTLLLMAGSNSYSAAINLTKHDGTGTYKHITKNAGEFEAIAVRSVGVLEGFIQRQEGQSADGGWSQMYLSGYYTTDASDDPNAMGGDYWGIQGRVAFGGPDIKLVSFAGEAGRVSLHVEYDWPVP